MSSQEEKTAAQWLKETQKGYIRIAVLILLSKRPYHGYEIMKEIKERTGGFWRPTAGGIYPILQDLEKSGYVEGEWGTQKRRKRKTYKVTGTGNLVLQRALGKESQIANSMSDLFREFMKDVLEVRMNPIPVPRMPNFFSVFLEERKKKPEDTTSVLECKRAQIEDMIKELQKELGTINRRLSQLAAIKRPEKRGKASYRRRQ
jgi:DNA-binding PadR family transcriptional regulator